MLIQLTDDHFLHNKLAKQNYLEDYFYNHRLPKPYGQCDASFAQNNALVI